MATAVILNDSLVHEATERAASEGESVEEFVERAVRRALRSPVFPVANVSGGLREGVTEENFKEKAREADEDDLVEKLLRAGS